MGNKKVSILAIDDEIDFGDTLRQYFEPRDFQIDTSLDGYSGIELFKKKRHNIVLLDLKMSGGGDELLRNIKEIDDAVRMIIVTAFRDSGGIKSRLLDQGAYAYVEKPVASLKELEKLINQAVSEREGSAG